MNLGHWQFLTGFFRLGIVRIFISWFALVPLAVAILRSVPKVIYVDSAFHPVALHMELPFNWITLWIASLFFSAAALLFHVFCPAFIKRHESWEQYKKIGHSPRWIVWELHLHMQEWGLIKRYDNSRPLREILIEKQLAEVVDVIPCAVKPAKNSCVERRPDGSTLYFQHDGKNYGVRSVQSPEATDQKENDIFWELFGFLAGSHPQIRRTISSFIYISFILVAVVIVENIWSAFTYMAQ